MLNPIDEMRKLSLKSYDELLRIATNNCGFCPNGKKYSKIEVITYIVSNAAIRSYFGDRLNNLTEAAADCEHERKRYVLYDENATHHVMLTKEQVDFMYWCADKEINFYNLAIEEPFEIEWEKP